MIRISLACSLWSGIWNPYFLHSDTKLLWSRSYGYTILMESGKSYSAFDIKTSFLQLRTRLKDNFQRFRHFILVKSLLWSSGSFDPSVTRKSLWWPMPLDRLGQEKTWSVASLASLFIGSDWESYGITKPLILSEIHSNFKRLLKIAFHTNRARFIISLVPTSDVQNS